jgi:rubrerythrin
MVNGMKKRHYLLSLVAVSLALAVQLQADPAKTIANLNTAFRGESNASHRYEAFAKKADAEGYSQVAALFRAASKAEAIHRDAHKEAIAKLGGKADSFALDEVKIGSTKENLQAAIKGESYERDVMYPDFLKSAKADDLKPAIRTINFALAAETDHAKLYQDALDNLGKNAATTFYVCPVCGHTVKSLPDKNCPVCGANKAKFLEFK